MPKYNVVRQQKYTISADDIESAKRIVAAQVAHILVTDNRLGITYDSSSYEMNETETTTNKFIADSLAKTKII